MTPNFMVFVFARAVILILPEAGRRGSVGRGAEPDRGPGSGLGRGVVTQDPRAGCISGVGIRPFFASGCGEGGKFCDANRPNRPTARTPAAAKGTPLWATGGKASKTEGPRGLGGICISPIRG